jgi:uncharacterized membrane protein
MTDRMWAIIVWGCNVASYFTLGGASIIGLIIAYVKRGELRGTIYESHMTSAIRTFWISFAGFCLGGLFALAGVGLLIILAVWCWHVFRTVRGLIRAIDDKPIADAAGWL